MIVPGLRALDWAIITVSFFNTIALLWLGLTVLLNAERRTWATWVAGGGLLLGGLFFAGHSAVVGRVAGTFEREMEFWWRVSWLPIVGLPYAWYLVATSYTGILRAGRHHLPLALVTLLGLAALALLILANPLPSYDAVIHRSPITVLTLKGVPLLAVLYPFYSVVCILLALDAFRRPEASERFMGDLARRRARPWLIAASVVLLAISLIFGAAMAWFLRLAQDRPPALFFRRSLALFMGFDLLISILVAAAVVLTGRALVGYEVFTGKALPRGGLHRYWRRSLILAAGYGVVVGGSLSVPIDPIYRLLLATILMTAFYALLSWRSYAERERSIEHLRPFVRSQQLYDRLLKPAGMPDGDGAAPFRALCEDVLGARVAYLAALPPLAPLVGSPLAYPDGAALPQPVAAELPRLFRSPQTMYVPLEPADYGGAIWAVSLWSERGLAGVLLLGEKRDGGLYTQEEIEIARATGERLIDTRASAEMARRLMALQRQRLVESQVIDRRTRRVLHDDVLPRLHAAMLMLSARQPVEVVMREAPGAEKPALLPDMAPVDPSSDVVQMLAGIHQEIANLLHDLPAAGAPDVERLGFVRALKRTVESELGGAFDRVTWRIDPDAERAAQVLPHFTAEVVLYAAREAIRNAARYGRGADPGRALHLRVSVASGKGLEIVIEDDGIGLDGRATGLGGSGHGLALHSTMMAVVGGDLAAESTGSGTRVTLTLPRDVWEGAATITRRERA